MVSFDDFLFSNLGETGKYQRRKFFLIFLPSIFSAMHVLSWPFASYDGGEMSSLDCDSPLFNATLNYTRFSTTHRWSLVCDRAWIRPTVQSAYYYGQMIGSLLFGYLGDKIGRKKVFNLAILLQTISGLLMAVVPHVHYYFILRLLTGVAHPGVTSIAIVLGTEMLGPAKRKAAAVTATFASAAGYVALASLSWLIPDYQMLHLAIGLPTLLFMVYWWVIPESPRWLVAKGKYEAADEVLQRVAKTNHVQLPAKWWTQLDGYEKLHEDDKEEQQSSSLLDLVRTPRMRLRTLIVLFLWPVVSMVYYGMAMKADVFGGDIFSTFIVGSLVEVPAGVFVLLYIDSLGRRSILATGYILCGASLLASAFIDQVPLYIAFIQVFISRGAISATYTVIYAYSLELFPTTLRNSTLGICTMVARFGAIAATYLAMMFAEYNRAYMTVPFGVCCVLAAGLALLLPETAGKPLPQTLEDIEGPKKPKQEVFYTSASHTSQ